MITEKQRATKEAHRPSRAGCARTRRWCRRRGRRPAVSQRLMHQREYVSCIAQETRAKQAPGRACEQHGSSGADARQLPCESGGGSVGRIRRLRRISPALGCTGRGRRRRRVAGGLRPEADQQLAWRVRRPRRERRRRQETRAKRAHCGALVRVPGAINGAGHTPCARLPRAQSRSGSQASCGAAAPPLRAASSTAARSALHRTARDASAHARHASRALTEAAAPRASSTTHARPVAPPGRRDPHAWRDNGGHLT